MTLTESCCSVEVACVANPTADVFINFASFRSAAALSMAALKQPTIRVVAIVAEGVPESDTKQLIAFACSNNKESKLEHSKLLGTLLALKTSWPLRELCSAGEGQ
ncbi:ATP-citrate synthase beta chain protein 1 [Linum grandiflorum]